MNVSILPVLAPVSIRATAYPDKEKPRTGGVFACEHALARGKCDLVHKERKGMELESGLCSCHQRQPQFTTDCVTLTTHVGVSSLPTPIAATTDVKLTNVS